MGEGAMGPSWISGRVFRVIAAALIAGGLTAGCATSNAGRVTNGATSSAAPTSPATVTATSTASAAATRAAGAQGCLVGASWWGGQDNPLSLEEPALEKAIVDAGGSVKVTDARSFVGGQAKDIDSLIAAGAKVIVVEPGPDTEVVAAVQKATAAGIPVLTFSRPIDHTKAVYVDFDLVEIGRQEARALLAVKPKGTYAIVKGDPQSAMADLITAGIRETLQPAVDKGDVTVVATVDTPGWDQALAEQEMTAILSQNGGRVDAVVTEDDFLVTAVQRVLERAGLSGKVAVATVNIRDGGFVGINRGTQAVSVWGNPELLGTAAGRTAVELCGNPDTAKIAGGAPLNWPGHDPVNAVLVKTVPITKDNLDVVISTDIHWRQKVCYAPDPVLDPSGQPPACKTGG